MTKTTETSPRANNLFQMHSRASRVAEACCSRVGELVQLPSGKFGIELIGDNGDRAIFTEDCEIV